MSVIKGQITRVSPSLTLGSLGAGGIILRTLSEMSPTRTGDVFGAVAESDALGGLLAGLTLVGTELQILATVTGMLFFGYSVYALLPRAFPSELEDVSGRRSYRLLAAALVIGAAEFVNTVLLGPTSPQTGGILFLVVVALILSVCIGYVILLVRLDLTDIEPAARAVSERLNIDGPARNPEAVETATLRQRLSYITSVGLMIAIPLPFLGMAVSVAGLLYPVPELLAIGWAGIAIVDNHTNRAVADRAPDQERTNVEGSAFDLAVSAMRSQKGIPAVMLTIVGFSSATGLVVGLNIAAFDLAQTALSFLDTDPLYTWTTAGFLVTIVVCAAFGTWFWIRVIRRMPAYLQAWNQAKTETSPLADEELPKPVTRPIGMLVPFLLAFWPAMFYMRLRYYDYFFGSEATVQLIYSIAWPVLLMPMAWVTIRTRKTGPQSPLSENIALPVALLVGLGFVPAFSYINQFLARAAGYPVPQSSNGGLIGIVMILVLFVWPDVSARGDDATGWLAFQESLFLFGAGVAFVIGAVIDLTPGFGFVLGAAGVMLILMSGWEFLRRIRAP